MPLLIASYAVTLLFNENSEITEINNTVIKITDFLNNNLFILIPFGVN